MRRTTLRSPGWRGVDAPRHEKCGLPRSSFMTSHQLAVSVSPLLATSAWPRCRGPHRRPPCHEGRMEAPDMRVCVLPLLAHEKYGTEELPPRHRCHRHLRVHGPFPPLSSHSLRPLGPSTSTLSPPNHTYTLPYSPQHSGHLPSPSPPTTTLQPHHPLPPTTTFQLRHTFPSPPKNA